MESVRVDEQTHRRLIQIVGILHVRDGKRKTIEDSIRFLLDEHKRKKDAEKVE